jgi:hypothetical protein
MSFGSFCTLNSGASLKPFAEGSEESVAYFFGLVQGKTTGLKWL